MNIYFGFVSILGTLIIHNILISFQWHKSLFPYKSSQIFSQNNSPKTFACSVDNNYCLDFWSDRTVDLLDCNTKKTWRGILYENEKYKIDVYKKDFFINSKIKNEFKNKKIKAIFYPLNEVNVRCIKNSKGYFIYKKFPFVAEKFFVFINSKKYYRSTGDIVNPFIYGETTISNIAKRYPVNFFFKTLLIITSVLMFLYWQNFNIFFKNINKTIKTNTFMFFGISSSLLLFLHLMLLGYEPDIKIIKNIKSLVLLMFILCEILAQFFIVKKLYVIKSNGYEFLNAKILIIKKYFVRFFLVIMIILGIFTIITDIPKKYIILLEWNLFTILLFFYLFSFFLLKKNTNF